jgi:hypothetical protein
VTDIFGKYQSQTTRQLAQIDSSKYPDTNKDIESNLVRLNGFVDYISQYLQQMQKGVDQANQDVFGKIKDFGSNIAVLLGGGQIFNGLDLGDLQYMLPALGALLGFDADTPFPLNLFEAAEHFFLGYIVPLDAFVATIEDMILGFLSLFGLDEESMATIKEFLDVIVELGTGFQELFENILGLLDIFGINTDGFGPFADLWHAISQLLGGLSLESLGDVLNPVFHTLAPWIHQLSQLLTMFNNVIKAFSGGLVTTEGLINLGSLFDFTSLLGPGFDPANVWASLINLVFLPLNLLLGPNSPLNALNIFGLIPSWLIGLIPLGSITDTTPNLLSSQGSFPSADSMGTGVGWSWDAAVGRNSPGSAKAVAGSVNRDLASVVKIPVVEGQVVNLSIWLKWSSLFYTGTTPISIGVVKFLDDVETGITIVNSVNSPATNQVAFIQLQGDYTVPAGVDEVQVLLRVASAATGGTVWFDDGSAKKPTNGLPQSWIFDLIPNLAGLQDFAEQIVHVISSVIHGIPFAGGFLGDLFDDLTDWFDDTQATAAQAGDALLGVQATQDIIVSGITMAPQTGVDDDAVTQAVTSQTTTIISQGAAIEALTSQSAADGNAGVVVLDDFEETFTGQLNPAKWQKFVISGTSPTMETANGHDASMSTNGEVIYRYIGTGEHTLTNYQRVAVTIASQLTYPGFGDSRRSRQAAVCRMSDDGTKWVRAQFVSDNRLIVDYRNGGSSGVLHDSGSYAVQTPGPGSSLIIEPGVGVDARKFKIWRGRTPLVIVDDAGSATDITQLGHGMGMYIDSGFESGAYTQYNANDNAPPAVPGTQFRAYRDSTSQVNLGSRGPGDFVISNNFFGTTDYITNGFLWDGTTQTLTCVNGGIYNFGVLYWSDSGLNASMEWAAVLFRDTGSGMSLFKRAMAAVPGANTTHQVLQGVFVNVKLSSGDKIKPGIRLGTFVGANNFSGDVDGIKSEFTAMKVA